MQSPLFITSRGNSFGCGFPFFPGGKKKGKSNKPKIFSFPVSQFSPSQAMQSYYTDTKERGLCLYTILGCRCFEKKKKKKKTLPSKKGQRGMGEEGNNWCTMALTRGYFRVIEKIFCMNHSEIFSKGGWLPYIKGWQGYFVFFVLPLFFFF